MSEIINISIDLQKIDKSKIKQVTKKDGTIGKYLDVTIMTKDEPDQFGNTASLSIALTKAEREAKVPAIYLGNGKVTFRSDGKVATPSAPASNQMGVNNDDLPF